MLKYQDIYNKILKSYRMTRDQILTKKIFLIDKKNLKIKFADIIGYSVQLR